MTGRTFLKRVFSRPIAFYPVLAEIAGSVTAGLMLSQAIYWSDIQESSDPKADGWFYKTQVEWERETFLTRYEQEGARRLLKAKRLIVEERRGIPAQLFYRVDFDVVQLLINQLIAEKPQSGLRETSNQEVGKPADRPGEKPQSGMGKTTNLYKEAETTTENTHRLQSGPEISTGTSKRPAQQSSGAVAQSQPQPQQRQGLTQNERDSWDLRRLREKMADEDTEASIGARPTYSSKEGKQRAQASRIIDAAYLAGLTIPRAIELLRPFYQHPDDQGVLEMISKEIKPDLFATVS